jgi:uncharacterized protein YpmS
MVMKNKWKLAFYVLLCLNVVLLALGIVLVKSPIEDTKVKQINVPSGDSVSFHVASNKNDLNRLINHYLEKEVSETPINYRVLLGNEVELYGTIPFFSEELDMKLTFEPEALKNGDLVLRQKEISIGRLQLPVAYVLKFIRDQYKLPKGVTIQPNDELIYISMANIKLKSDIKIKVDEFDLKRDKISFNLLVPVK